MLIRSTHPLWMCGMRPFFVLAAALAALQAALWAAVLAGAWPAPAVAGGPFAWHAHELLFGYALAAATGFTLVAVPEFTGTAGFGPAPVRGLVALWLAGRVGFWGSALPGLWGRAALLIAAAAHVGLLIGLAALLAPRLWQDPARRHRAFLWALMIWTLLAIAFYVEAWQGGTAARWLNATLGLLLALIVVAMSRISMRIVNRALDEAGAPTDYRARPPRRNLAILCIGLYTLAELVAPGGKPAGWLALATAAALFNLQGDWHVGRPLLRRWPLLLHLVYVLMALGYLTTGVALLAGDGNTGAGRHLLTMGAVGLNIYVVLCIAGRTHCGRALDARPWVVVGAALIVGAALLRAVSAWWGGAPLMALAGSGWSLAWLLILVRLGPVLWGPREDGLTGCAGPAPDPAEPAVMVAPPAAGTMAA